MGDNPLSTPVSPQRKLPIPANGANTNSTLKGILIKPKRILPAQPDNQKLKRNLQEAGSECKADDTVNENSRAEINPSCKSENANKNSLHKVTIPKLSIDVDKLKTHFQLHGKATGRSGSLKTDLNENEITKNNSEIEANAPLRSHSECGNVTHDFLQKENKIFDFESDGVTKVKQWCSASEIGNMTTKMPADASVTKSLERNIRSPSPKSSATWDRSSSGYSSDERADPRSPPPSHSASVSVSSKTETELTNDDDALISNNGEASETHTDVETENENDQLPCTENEKAEKRTNKAENSGSSDSVVTIQANLNEMPLTDTSGAQVDSCEVSNLGVEKNDTTNSCVNFPFDSSVGAKQSIKRPAWTAHSPLPGNGRIQYRKSGSESMIHLRHSSRQGMVDTNFGGLEVCGKSFPQPANNNSAKNDSSLSDGANSEASGRQEILSPTSAFAPVPRLATSTGHSCSTESGQIDSTSIEMSARTRILRQYIPTCRSPRDIKSLGFGTSVKLTLPKDDKDIRKSLHDLNSPRRQPTVTKSVPVRARHPIQTVSVVDTMTNQPIGINVSNGQRSAISDSGKCGIKQSSKKMWRAPSGQPENAQARPFSPFGGTLPPSKIKEHEKMKHENDEPAQ